MLYPFISASKADFQFVKPEGSSSSVRIKVHNLHEMISQSEASNSELLLAVLSQCKQQEIIMHTHRHQPATLKAARSMGSPLDASRSVL